MPIGWTKITEIEPCDSEGELLHHMAALPGVMNSNCLSAWKIEKNVDGLFYLMVGSGRWIPECKTKPVFPKPRKPHKRRKR